MKLFAAILFLISFSALANCNREAQFAGKVTNLKVLENSFTFQVKLGGWFSPSMICPMYSHELENAVLEYPGSPRIANGDPVSGVMVFNEATQKYLID